MPPTGALMQQAHRPAVAGIVMLVTLGMETLSGPDTAEVISRRAGGGAMFDANSTSGLAVTCVGPTRPGAK